MSPIPLERLDPHDDQAFADLLALEAAALAVDQPYLPPPTPTAARAFRLHGWDDQPPQEWLHRDPDGRAVGRLRLRLPTWDNRHLALGGVRVHPEHRRRGIGRALAGRLRELARESGRRVLVSGSVDTPATRAFAAALGFRQVSVDIQRRQDLQTVDWERAGELRDQARKAARDYILLRFTGPVPEELVTQVAALEAAINDRPMDDFDMEDEVFTADRIRNRERSIAAAGLRVYRVVARRVPDGDLAGHTIVEVDPERPEYAEQGDTSVLAAHRGHRLGLLLKAEMMHWLAEVEPGVRWVDTDNAETNQHMIAINDALGYQVIDRMLGWQCDL